MSNEILKELKELKNMIKAQDVETREMSICTVGDKEYLTREEVCAWLGLGWHSVQIMREEGLPYYRIGSSANSRVLFRKKDVIEHMAKYRV